MKIAFKRQIEEKLPLEGGVGLQHHFELHIAVRGVEQRDFLADTFIDGRPDGQQGRHGLGVHIHNELNSAITRYMRMSVSRLFLINTLKRKSLIGLLKLNKNLSLLSLNRGSTSFWEALRIWLT